MSGAVQVVTSADSLVAVCKLLALITVAKCPHLTCRAGQQSSLACGHLRVLGNRYHRNLRMSNSHCLHSSQAPPQLGAAIICAITEPACEFCMQWRCTMSTIAASCQQLPQHETALDWVLAARRSCD